MDNTLEFWQKQILSLNSQLINSEIALEDYHKNVETIFRGVDCQMRIQLGDSTFSTQQHMRSVS